jgi:6-methylsalicylate decarboxylase
MLNSNDPSRRDFLANLAALGAGALVAGAGTMQAQANPRRLDLHHHFVSPGLAKKASEVRRQGWETLRDYTPQATIEKMDKAGIQTGFCSLTTPGIWMGDDFRIERADALRLAREMNEFAAKMMSDYKGRFGLFTVLPMPDVDATLKEIEYGFDTLKADGAGFLSSYGISGEDLKGTPPPTSRLAQVRRFYYDTAGSANPVLIQGLKTLLGDASHIVFGTDIPFGDGMAIVNGLKSCGLSADELRGVDRENAVRILPKYRT